MYFNGKLLMLLAKVNRYKVNRYVGVNFAKSSLLQENKEMILCFLIYPFHFYKHVVEAGKLGGPSSD